ncbi:MAG: hypothetical protein KDA44_00445 [Planctomycetales bacterium]|nr:hypothetical protein [Planctomycetales bacterium]
MVSLTQLRLELLLIVLAIARQQLVALLVLLLLLIALRILEPRLILLLVLLLVLSSKLVLLRVANLLLIADLQFVLLQRRVLSNGIDGCLQLLLKLRQRCCLRLRYELLLYLRGSAIDRSGSGSLLKKVGREQIATFKSLSDERSSRRVEPLGFHC